MKPTQFRSIRRALGLSAAACERMLGIGGGRQDGRTVRTWETDPGHTSSRPIPEPVAKWLRALDKGWIEPEDLEDL